MIFINIFDELRQPDSSGLMAMASKYVPKASREISTFGRHCPEGSKAGRRGVGPWPESCSFSRKIKPHQFAPLRSILSISFCMSIFTDVCCLHKDNLYLSKLLKVAF